MGRFSKAKTMLWMPLALGLAVACGDQPVENAVEELGVVARMDVVAGDAQTGEVGTQLSNPLVVRVSDALGRPVQNQIVNFRVTEGGGSVFAGAAITDAQGRAQEWWTLGDGEGDNKVEARAVDTASGEKVVFARFSAKAVKKGAPVEEEPTAPVEEEPDTPVEEEPSAPVEEEPATGGDKGDDSSNGGEEPEEPAAEPEPEAPAEAPSTAWARGKWEISGGGLSAMLDLDARTITLPGLGTVAVTRSVSGDRLNVSFTVPKMGAASMALQHRSGRLEGTARVDGRSESVVARRPAGSTPTEPSQPVRPQEPQPQPQEPQQPAPPSSGTGGLLFGDDFEGYSVGSRVQNSGSKGFRWTSGNGDGVFVANDRSRSGTRSLRFRFGSSAQDSHIWSEQRFEHPEVQEYWVEYYVFVPSNYHHQPTNSSANNNKFYAFWGRNGYSAPGAGSFQLWTPKDGGLGGGSTINVGRYGPRDAHLTYPRVSGNGGQIFSRADAGKWVQIRIHLRLADENQSNGVQRLWKNNQLIVDVRGDQNYAGSRSSNYYSFGYLFGYDNSGYRELTDFYVDDFQMFTANPGW